MSKLVLVRNGQSMGNVWGQAYENAAMNFLTKRGTLEAELAGMKLAETGIVFRHMYVSEITRARHTLAIIAHATRDWQREFVVHPGLNERIDPEYIHDQNDRISQPFEHKKAVESVLKKEIIPSLDDGHVLVVSHYHTMEVLFRALGVRLDRLWGVGHHIPNAVPFIWDPDEPDRMVVLNDETRIPRY